jgi:hypothetical protein
MRLLTALQTATGVALLAGAAWAAHAMANDGAPPAKDFVRDGQSYRWSVAHGVTGALAVTGPIRSTSEGAARVEIGRTYLVLGCSGLKSAAVQARFYGPVANATQLRVRTADAVFRVRAGTEVLGDQTFVGGHGDLPDGYLASLARAPTVSIEYGGQVATLPGPGKALAEHFGRYCAQLAQRASHDE